MNIVLMDRVESVSFTTNFVGKVSGITVGNPNIYKSAFNKTSLQNPVTVLEASQVRYDQVKALDASISSLDPTSINGGIAQHVFFFDLISLIERQYGTIPAGDTAGKVAWLKANVTALDCSWWGYGSSPLGNKASLDVWSSFDNVWVGSPVTTTNGVVTKLTRAQGVGSIFRRVDDNGFVHFIAYADASNGTIASTINTDYVELLITLNIRQ